MKKANFLISFLMLFLLLGACSESEKPDQEKPTIDISFSGAFPTNCDTIYFGEPFVLRMKFSDNLELGAFSIDIHNNFDHHSHSTEVTECDLNPIKDPVNPYVSIMDYSIPEGLKEYETNLTISIPESDGIALYDEGDYHFFISLTDKEGWSAQRGLSIKMLHR
ncbi:DUF4625 domain-containing protein [Draconibacterium orientale]|uniref:DUF4625 domain-containing protein n=1 Tax=Draconibacterium orientale TaxID=1168034 RepID=UPI002ABE45C1|nr:DUF4625 domain-containing protein [Draconibacterium orientale]